MKHSFGVAMLAIIGTLHASALMAAESHSTPISNFLIDPSKPYVYLEIDHIGPRTPGDEHEPNTGIYLRLKNNCRLPIIVSTFGGPIDGTDGENVWSAAALQAKNENDIVGLRECIRPFCERLLWALMECAAPLSYLIWQAF